jgi:hypothetical protein
MADGASLGDGLLALGGSFSLGLVQAGQGLLALGGCGMPAGFLLSCSLPGSRPGALILDPGRFPGLSLVLQAPLGGISTALLGLGRLSAGPGGGLLLAAGLGLVITPGLA